MLRATIDEPVPLQVQAADGRTDLFARAKVYDTAGGLVDTVSLPHLDEGLYGSTKIFTAAGYFTAAYVLYEDVGFTIEAEYDIEAETIEAGSDKSVLGSILEGLTKLLGLSYDNSVLEPVSFSPDGCMTEARIKAYDSKANAELDDEVTGLLFSWTVKATYTSGRLDRYEVTRD